MKRRLRIVVACVLALLIAVVSGLVWLRNHDDPEFQGKRLSVWTSEFQLWSGPITPQAIAIHQYGSRAGPMLNMMLRKRDSDLGLKIRQLATRQNLIKIQYQPAAFAQERALDVCNCIGMEVKDEVPVIAALVRDYPRAIQKPGLVNYALETLALMGPDGGRALVEALDHPDASIRRKAAEILGTAPMPATAEMIAALERAATRGDPMMKQTATRALTRLQERRDQHIPDAARTWSALLDSDPAGGMNLWSLTSGSRITASTGIVSGYDEDCVFGRLTASNPSGVAIFKDGQAEGFAHRIEWQVPAAVTVRSFGLLASHDPGPVGFQRPLRGFRLYAQVEGSVEFTLVYTEEVPVPFGQGGYGCRLLMFRNLDHPVVARRFRAEFIQNGDGPFQGPRVIELFGFGSRLNRDMVLNAMTAQMEEIQLDVRNLLDKECPAHK